MRTLKLTQVNIGMGQEEERNHPKDTELINGRAKTAKLVCILPTRADPMKTKD